MPPRTPPATTTPVSARLIRWPSTASPPRLISPKNASEAAMSAGRPTSRAWSRVRPVQPISTA